MQDFEAAVLATVAAIPSGTVLAYGEVARRAGYPGRARQVGSLLARLPAHNTLPWHRVLRADGRIAPRATGCREQQERLRTEGVEVGPGGRIPARYFSTAAAGAERRET